MLLYATRRRVLLRTTIGFLVVSLFFTTSAGQDERPDLADIIKSCGYPAETHVVQTDDGYLLTLHRIPGPSRNLKAEDDAKRNEGRLPGMPVILVHGLASLSAQWVMLGPNNSLGYSLADHGFDVWLANLRGSPYAKKHVSLDYDSFEFWDFSWEQHGVHDMPATIDYVLNQTGFEKTWYIGYSMGTTTFFVLGSMRPKYNAKIKHSFMLAPTAIMGRARTRLHDLAPNAKFLHDAFAFMGIGRLGAPTWALPPLRDTVCAISEELCEKPIDDLIGFNKEQYYEEREEPVNQFFPNYVSTKQCWHYSQCMHKGTFGPLITDPSREAPPEYNITKITVPMTFMYGQNDKFDSPEDVEELASRFTKNTPRMHKISLESFDHLDFMWGRDKHLYIIDPLINYMGEIIEAEGPIRRVRPPVKDPGRPNTAGKGGPKNRKNAAKHLLDKVLKGDTD